MKSRRVRMIPAQSHYVPTIIVCAMSEVRVCALQTVVSRDIMQFPCRRMEKRKNSSEAIENPSLFLFWFLLCCACAFNCIRMEIVWCIRTHSALSLTRAQWTKCVETGAQCGMHRIHQFECWIWTKKKIVQKVNKIRWRLTRDSAIIYLCAAVLVRSMKLFCIFCRFSRGTFDHKIETKWNETSTWACFSLAPIRESDVDCRLIK